MAGNKMYDAGYTAGVERGKLLGQDEAFKQGYNHATEAWKKRNVQLQHRISQLTDDAGDMLRHVVRHQYGSEYDSYANVKDMLTQMCPKQAEKFEWNMFLSNLKWPETRHNDLMLDDDEDDIDDDGRRPDERERERF